MTLNTAANLAAASALPMVPAVSVRPDAGDPDQGWLQAAGWGYPGVLSISSSAEAAAPFHFVYRRRRRLKAKKFIA